MLLSKKYESRLPSWVALLSMLVLLVFAWHFYIERVVYYDLAWHVFKFIWQGGPFILNRRSVAALTQFPVLGALKAGWSLDAVMQLYSVSFIFYYLAVFALCAYWLRNEHVAIVVPLLFTLLAARTFYWAQSELPQTLALLVLFYAGVSRETPLRLRVGTLLLAALVPFIIFGHPLAMIPFLFIWGYDWLLNRRFRDWLYYALLVWGFGLYKYRMATIPPGSYESQNLTFSDNLKLFFPYYHHLGSFHDFWHLCRTNFVALPILLAVLSIFYVRQRDWTAWLRMVWMWAFAGGYAFIVCVSRPEYTEATYLENLYLPLGLFVAIPFALELLPALERKLGPTGQRLVVVVLVLVFGLRLLNLWQYHVPYTAYQTWLRQTIRYTRQFPEHRFLLNSNNADPHQLRAGWPWWASPFESLLQSARYSPDSAQTILIASDLGRHEAQGQQTGTFLGPFDEFPMPDRELSARYFHLPSTKYRILNTSPPTDTAALQSYIADRKGIRLNVVSLAKSLRAGQSGTVVVRLTVPAQAQPIHSGLQTDHPTLVRSQFLLAEPGQWSTGVEPTFSPLELDVYEPWTQTIPITCPAKPGRYELEIALLSRGYRDWPAVLRVPVTIEP